MSKHIAIERDGCGMITHYCSCGFGEKDPKSPDVIANHIFQLQYVADIGKDKTYKKWTGFKKGSHFNPEKKEDKHAAERLSRAMMEKLVDVQTVKPDEKEPATEESVKTKIETQSSDEIKDERDLST